MNIRVRTRFAALAGVLLMSFSNQPSAGQEAIALFEDGKLLDAKEQFEQELDQSGPDSKSVVLAYLARIALRQQQLDKAKELANQAVELSPNTPIVQFSYGIVMSGVARNAKLFSALGYAKKSLVGYTKAVALEPDNITYRQSLLGYHMNAPGLAGGDKGIALEQAEAIKGLNLKLGIQALIGIYTATGNDVAMKTLFSGMPEEFNNDPDILFYRGIYRQNQKDYPAAVQYFERAIKYAGEVEEFQQSKFGALYQIGRTSVVSKKQLQYGIESLQRYLDTAPDLPGLPSKEWAQFRMANLIEASGRKEEATVTYKQLVKTSTDKGLKKAIKAVL